MATLRDAYNSALNSYHETLGGDRHIKHSVQVFPTTLLRVDLLYLLYLLYLFYLSAVERQRHAENSCSIPTDSADSADSAAVLCVCSLPLLLTRTDLSGFSPSLGLTLMSWPARTEPSV